MSPPFAFLNSGFAGELSLVLDGVAVLDLVRFLDRRWLLSMDGQGGLLRCFDLDCNAGGAFQDSRRVNEPPAKLEWMDGGGRTRMWWGGEQGLARSTAQPASQSPFSAVCRTAVRAVGERRYYA